MLELKQFYKRLESVFADVDAGASPERLAQGLAPELLERLGRPLGLRAAHLYGKQGVDLTLRKRWGEGRPDLSSELTRRMSSVDERDIIDLPWAGETAAGRVGILPVDDAQAWMIALFAASPGELHGVISPAQFSSTVTSLHYALDQHRRRSTLEDLFEQARAIQISLLPHRRPHFGDFDIAAASVPAQSVGGDLYDFIHVDAETLGVAVADSSGHGLPAALQARDVVTGLRMGVERDLKITRTIEKLNRVIHRSGLVTRFISLIFGELEKNGNFSYINAGHPPGLLLDNNGIRELTVGGTILGPMPDATYKLGFAHVDRGAALALFTDGVVEHCIGEGNEGFGDARVQEWLRDWRGGPSHDAVDNLIQRLRTYGGGVPFEDDVTVVMLRRPA
jgi:sigma-B regulation protein RsbU (phosphoserine phosphatase)